ncbi:perosamine synthetase [Oxalobacteraceae bacterium GrIS 1.11]
MHAIFGTSDTVADYEKGLAVYFDSPYAIAISSGAAALTVSFAAVGVKPDDEVILTPTCPLCTVHLIIAASAKPVFVDTRADGFGIDLRDLDRALSPRTRAIVDIPMWGYPTQVDELQNFARNCGIAVILDLAHAHGTLLHGRPLSSYGDLSCFSTHERKPLATGEGGFILASDPLLAERCRSYSRFGNLNGRDVGLSYKLGALSAALGLARLNHLDDQLQPRRENAAAFLGGLTNPKVVESTVIPGGEPNYYFLNLRLGFSDNKKFIDYLDQNGIPSDIKRYGCRCLYEFPALAEYRRLCPNGEALLVSMTTIPMHPGLSKEDMAYMVNLINSYQETA